MSLTDEGDRVRRILSICRVESDQKTGRIREMEKKTEELEKKIEEDTFYSEELTEQKWVNEFRRGVRVIKRGSTCGQCILGTFCTYSVLWFTCASLNI